MQIFNCSLWKLVKLSDKQELKPFSCSDKDLNEFLNDDARNFAKELLAVTYLLETDKDIIAYFSLLNDKINLKESKRNERKHIDGVIPHAKRYGSYPSVKIGRLAVSEKYEGHGYGGRILDLIKSMFVHNNRTGCRYITVDAYTAATSFYENNGFKFLTVNDAEDDTRLMYYDLKAIIS